MTIDRISKEELLANYDTFLFDADGVLWTGEIPVPGAIEWLNLLLDDKTKKVFVLTNNSTKTLDQYMKKIEKLGFGRLGSDNVISPAIVLAEYLQSNPGKFAKEYVYLIGTENLRATLENDGGVKCFGTGPDSIRDHTDGDFIHHVDMSLTPKAVVCSYDAHFSYPKIMKAANFLQDPNVEYLVTNQDYTFPGPVPGVVIPGSGATSAAVTAVTGREPTVFGKPHKPMADFLLRRAQVDPKRTVMFGDRLDTDIMFGNANGQLSITPRQQNESEEPPQKQGWISKLLKGQHVDPSSWQKQSHSSLLSNSELMYEFMTHNYRPGEQEAYLDAFGKYKQEMNVKNPSIELVGSWTCSFGRTRDQAIHLWRHNKGYEDVDSSIALHGKDSGIRAADNDVAKLCGRRKNLIVKSFSYWREPEQRPPNHVYDLRSYVLQPGTMIDWASAWAKGIQYRREANQDVGGFFAQVGQLYVVYHIWAYPSMSDRNDTRHATWAKPGWDATVANTVPLIKKMQSKILVPTRFSQLE
ncbi:hypothetical protein GCK72_009338 [Caenorhabditis remanei]|uniref:NIPSNAP domain-containing protein n=1 Tax=Caenorhabditis remanei TaxID=31234 RepID=A0A6A5H2S4_CAERE|nr:hypothetical protein GCK72_009338 [Caenorhabditis remanei]KAF1761084.1 hypothetical protein GCK72_009338 [Caenorhabditis remanei]